MRMYVYVYVYVYAFLIALTLISGPTFAADRVLLTCPMFPGDPNLGASDILLVREADVKTSLIYNFQSENRRTLLEQVSGVEYMGSEGKYLVFFELLVSENRYLLTMIDTDTFEVTVNQKLDCRESE